MTFNWEFPDKSSIRTHLTTHHYSSPTGLSCDGNCNYDDFINKNKFITDVFLA